MSDHVDFETLSAVLDGEPEGDHVRACPICHGRLAELRVARDAVAQPVPPVAEDVRERAIAGALAAAMAAAAATSPAVAEGSDQAPMPAAARPKRTWWVAGSAAAAVLVVALGGVALVGNLSGSKPSDTASVSSGATAESATGFASPDSAVDAGDLGDLATVDALRARLSAAVAATTLAPAAAPTAGNALADRAVAPRQVGTRVCEIEARAARPSLGFVVYAANLRFQGTPAVALGFAATPSGPPEALLVLAPAQGCRILAETTP